MIDFGRLFKKENRDGHKDEYNGSGVANERQELHFRVVLVALAIAWVATAVFLLSSTGRDAAGKPVVADTGVYFQYAEKIRHGRLPYRDFRVEYPPLALLPMVVPVAFADTQYAYSRTFRLIVAALIGIAAAVALMAAKAAGERWRWAIAGGTLFVVGPVLLGQDLVATRFDLWPVLLALISVWALAAKRDSAAAGVIGLGTAAKLWPAFALPSALALAYRDGGKRGLMQAMGAFGLGLGIPVSLAVLASPTGFWTTLTVQGTRGLQVESLGAATLLLLSHLGLAGPYLPGSSLGQSLVGEKVNAVLAATTPLLLGLTILTATLGVREVIEAPDRREALRSAVRYGFAAVTAFVAFGRVLSPQFMLWLLPFPLLVGKARRWPAGAIVAACLVLTNAELRHYSDYAFNLSFGPTLLVFMRNAFLVVLFLLLIFPRYHTPFRDISLSKASRP